jgi:SET domain-containing protein
MPRKNKKTPQGEEKEDPVYYTNSKFKLEIKPSNITAAGLGVFTLEDIPNDTFIDTYDGEYMTTSSKLSKTDYYGHKLRRMIHSLYYIEVEKDIGIDATSYPRCFISMVNDCYNSEFRENTEFRNIRNPGEIPKVGLWTTREIKKGEELYVSYGDEYWCNIK